MITTTRVRAGAGALTWVLCAALLVACGGGGGGGGGGDSSNDGYPTLAGVGALPVPPLADPAARVITTGVERGRVLTASGVPAPAGSVVDVVDASNPSALRVVASGTTDAAGNFSVTADLSALAAAGRWLRVTVGGATLRAFAAGWTEVTPGTEAAVTEFARLRRAGRFATSPTLTALAASQDSLSLLWVSGHGSLAPAPAVASLLAEVRTHGMWNRWLERQSSGTADRPGDVTGLVPVSEASTPVTVVKDGGSPTNAALGRFCSANVLSDGNNCSLSAPPDLDLYESLGLDLGGARLRPMIPTPATPLGELKSLAGDLPLIEFAPVVGTRVVYESPGFLLRGARAAARIVRRTYPPEPVPGLSGSPPGVRVVLDYQIALIDNASGQQTDMLVREQRWFVPKAGRVRLDAQAWVRQGTQLSTDSLVVTADSAGGAAQLAPRVPFAGLADAVATGLRHHHAVHAAALDRLYASTPANGGSIVELDAQTMATLRTLVVGTMPRRLAVSADGQALFAGLDDGSIGEWRLADLALLSRSTALANPASSGVFDRILDLAVDPFDARRVLALLGSSASSTPPGVAVFRAGALVTHDAPDPSRGAPWGWPPYSPSGLAWSAAPNELLISGYQEVHRFAVGAGGFSHLRTQVLAEDAGWREVGGEIVTGRGSVLDALTLAPLRNFALAPLRLDTCMRFDAGSSLCRFRDDGVAPPNLLLLDHASATFIGVFQPVVTSVANGCPEQEWRENSLGLDDVTLTPMGGDRLLASHLQTANGAQRCSLQVWTLRGATP